MATEGAAGLGRHRLHVTDVAVCVALGTFLHGKLPASGGAENLPRREAPLCRRAGRGRGKGAGEEGERERVEELSGGCKTWREGGCLEKN